MRHKKNEINPLSAAAQARIDQVHIDQFNETVDNYFGDVGLTESIKLINRLHYNAIELRTLLVEKEEANLQDFTDSYFLGEVFEVQRLATFLIELFENWQNHPANRIVSEYEPPAVPKPLFEPKNFVKDIPGVEQLKGYSELYTTTVTGSAMDPDYPNGSLIIMERIGAGLWHTFSGLSVVADGNTTTFGRIVNNGLATTGILELYFQNPNDPPKRFALDEIWAVYEISSIHPGIMIQPSLS